MNRTHPLLVLALLASLFAVPASALAAIPSITSSPFAAGTRNQPFSYQITATDSPTSYGATGLPAGLSVNASSGLISGTPTSAGSFPVTMSANNGSGTSSARLDIIVVTGGPGSVDLSYAIGSGLNSTVTALAVQTDGRIIVGGFFSTAKGAIRNGVARLLANGNPDPTFNPGTGAENSNVSALAVQSDGKVLVGGGFSSFDGVARNRIVRLNADGSIDSSFAPGAGIGGAPNDNVQSIVVQSDGKVLVCGEFTTVGGQSRNRIARLNTDGTLDTSFNPGSGANNSVFSLAVQPDGKVCIGGSFTTVNGIARNGVARLNSGGGLDTTFVPTGGVTGSSARVRALEVQSDGKLVISGFFTAVNGTARNGIARMNSDGSIDLTFNPGTGASNNGVARLRLQTDGKVLIAGTFTSINGTPRNSVARLNSDGSLDAAFNPTTGVSNDVLALAVQADGKVLVGGSTSNGSGPLRQSLARVGADGTLDSGFVTNSGLSDDVTAMAVQPDGKSVIGGFFTAIQGVGRNRIARLDANGTLDGGFDPGLGVNFSIESIVIQPDGRILLAGGFSTVAGVTRNRVARLNADGTLDTSFNPSGGADNQVNHIAVQANGKILIGGHFTVVNGTARNGLARLNSDGSLDTTLVSGLPASEIVDAVAVQADGKVLIGGRFTSVAGVSCNRVARLNPDGTLDESFVANYGSSSGIYAIVMQSDGKVLIGGSFGARNIGRLNSDGSTDATFNPGGGANGSVLDIARYSDGKILIGGEFTTVNTITRWGVARLNADGTLDTDFLAGAETERVISNRLVAVQPNGDALVGGSFATFMGIPQNFLGRLKGESIPIPAVLDTPGFSWQAGGSAAWFGETSVTHDGVDAAQSGAIVGNQDSWIQTVVNGPGSLSFWWKVSSEPGHDFLRFTASGVEVPPAVAISGEVDWQQRTVSIPSGTHALRWSYSKDASVDRGSDAGWLDQVQYVGPPPAITSSANATGTVGQPFSYQITASNSPTSYGAAGLPAGLSVNTVSGVISGTPSGGGTFSAAVGATNSGGTGVATLSLTLIVPPAPIVTSSETATITANQPFIYQIAATNSPTSFSAVGLPAGLTLDMRTGLITGTPTVGGTFSVTISAINGGGSGSTTLTLTVSPPRPEIISSAFAAGTRNQPFNFQIVATGTPTVYTVSGLPTGLGVNPSTGLISGTPTVAGSFVASMTVTNSSGTTSAKLDVIIVTGSPGSVDVSFGSGSRVDSTVSAVAVQGDGKILAGGAFSTVRNGVRRALARLHSNGTADPSFYPQTTIDFVSAILVQADGKIWVGGSRSTGGIGKIERLSADGSVELSVDASSSVDTIAQQTDGKLVIGGSFTSVSGVSRKLVARVHANGDVDLGFNPGDLMRSFSVNAVALTSEGKILVAGDFSTGTGSVRNRLLRLNSDGSLDTTFATGSGLDGSAFAVAVQSDDRVIVGGDFSNVNGVARRGVARLQPDGSLDTTFNLGFGAPGGVNSVAVENSGKIVIGGNFIRVNGIDRNRVARLNGDGSLDLGFNPGSGTNGTVLDVVSHGAGRLIVAGAFETVDGNPSSQIVRLHANGTFDPGFVAESGVNGTVDTLASQSNGKTLIGGRFTWIDGTVRNSLGRLNADGSLDLAYNPGLVGDAVVSITVQPDGKALVGGEFTSVGGIARNRIARLNADGSLDPSFDPGLGANAIVNAVAYQSDGKVLLGGQFSSVNGNGRLGLARLNTDGSLDFTFNPFGTQASVSAIAVQPDGKLIIGGFGVNGFFSQLIRLNPDGTVDGGFLVGFSGAPPIALLPNGKIMVRGPQRLNPDGTVDPTFSAPFFSGLAGPIPQPDARILMAGSFFDGSLGHTGVARLDTNGAIDQGFAVEESNSPLNIIALQADGKVVTGGSFSLLGGIPRSSIARLHGDKPPLITSSTSAEVVIGQPFGYQIAATNSPTVFAAVGLPAGLGVDANTGLISGTPTQLGTYNVTISAINGAEGSATLVLTVQSAATTPVITSALTASASVNTAFSYQITASNSPTSFGAIGLPLGLSVSSVTGLISGSTAASGSFPITLTATNEAGTGMATLTLTVGTPTPVITSLLMASAVVGDPFSYQILATNNPINFVANGLPLGLSLNFSTGLISGTPTLGGTFSLTIGAFNLGGLGTATLELVVRARPTISSPVTATGTVGESFSYQIAASDSPTSFGASGLPAGLAANATTGAIMGAPQVAGNFSATVSATNAYGTGSGPLLLTIAAPPAVPAITSPATATATTKGPLSYQITATGNPQSFGASGLPAGVSVNPATGAIGGTPSVTGTFNITLSATNGAGTGTGPLTLIVAANSAPVLNDAGNPALPSIEQDVANALNTGVNVASLIAGLVTDADATDATLGVAITAVNNASGTWQFDAAGGTNWLPFGAPSETAARLLSASARLRFVPALGFTGTVNVGLTFRAWDRHTGVNGTTADVRTNGGESAFSTAVETVAIAVTQRPPDPAPLLVITGVMAGPPGKPSVIELFAVGTIANLSVYGLGTANDGGGSDGQEYTFSAVSVAAGQFIRVAHEGGVPGSFNQFFGFTTPYLNSIANLDGNDAVELFFNGEVIDTYGEIDRSGTGQPWEYTRGWAYRFNLTGASGNVFVDSNWIYSGVGALDGATDNTTAANRFPIGSYLATTSNVAPVVDRQFFHVLSTSAAGNTIGTMRASDANGDTLTFAITAGNGAGLVAIDAATGRLSVANAGGLAAAAGTSVTLSVRATDGGTPALQTIGQAVIQVLNGAAYPVPAQFPNFGFSAGGEVRALLTLGDGRVVVGGDFTSINGLQRANLAMMQADGTLDPTWAPQPNGPVRALAAEGATIYVGGDFTIIGGASRSRLAKLNIAVSDVPETGWNPAPNGPVLALALRGDALFVGGAFSNVGVLPRTNLAKVHAGTGALEAWNPAPNDAVRALVLNTSGTELYAGGDFTLLDTSARNRLARIDPSSAFVGAWDPALTGSQVRALALDERGLYVVGTFTAVGGLAANHLARVSPTDAALDSAWSPAVSVSASPRAIVAGSAGVYIAGDFTQMGGANRNRVAKLSAVDGSADPTWNPGANAAVNALAVDGTKVFAGGAFTQIGGRNRDRLALIAIPGAPTITRDGQTARLRITPNRLDGPEITHFQITFVTGGTLRLPDGVTDVVAGDFLSVENGAAGLTFVATPGSLVRKISAVAALEATPAGAGLAATVADLDFLANAITYQFAQAGYVTQEDGGTIALTVVKSGRGAGTVYYETLSGSASPSLNPADGDYNGFPGALIPIHFGENETVKTLVVPIWNDGDLFEGDEVFTVALSAVEGDALIGNPAAATVAIIDDDIVGTRGSVTEIQLPQPFAPPAHTGQIEVNIAPTNLGQWRIAGEPVWRDGGTRIETLATGEYTAEFLPVPGYLTPASVTRLVTTGTTETIAATYAPDGGTGTGSLRVLIKPDALPDDPANEPDVSLRGQWKLQGEPNTAWRNSGQLVTGLAAGTQIVEFKDIAGRVTPPGQALVLAGVQQVTGTYLPAGDFAAVLPAALSFAQVSGEEPYLFAGQIQSDVGFGSGVVVKQRVVLTVGHAVFNDLTLSAVANARWFHQRHRGDYEPVAQTPRGWYMHSGYAAQRQRDIEVDGTAPGISTAASQNLDMATLFFVEDPSRSDPNFPARGGFGGYLVTDSANDWLTGLSQKMLAGYPVERVPVADRGRLHATAPAVPPTVSFVKRYGNPSSLVYASGNLQGYEGMSGGALYAFHDPTDDAVANGRFYPVAIYLGGFSETLVRAIDDTMVDLINRAEQSGADGGNTTGGSSVVVIPGQTQESASSGTISVDPPAAAIASGRWRLLNSQGAVIKPYQSLPTAFHGIAPGSYKLEFSDVSTYVRPPILDIPVLAGQTTLVIEAYTQPFTQWRTRNFTTAEAGDDAISGLLADPDGDGLRNIFEFAFNLQAKTGDATRMTPGTGTRGLPAISIEGVGTSARLTIEFVRRKAAISPEITYQPEFTGDLRAATWQQPTVQVVTYIDAVWERVKVTDTVAPVGNAARFGRLRLIVAPPPAP